MQSSGCSHLASLTQQTGSFLATQTPASAAPTRPAHPDKEVREAAPFRNMQEPLFVGGKRHVLF